MNNIFVCFAICYGIILCVGALFSTNSFEDFQTFVYMRKHNVRAWVDRISWIIHRSKSDGASQLSQRPSSLYEIETIRKYLFISVNKLFNSLISLWAEQVCMCIRESENWQREKYNWVNKFGYCNRTSGHRKNEKVDSKVFSLCRTSGIRDICSMCVQRTISDHQRISQQNAWNERETRNFWNYILLSCCGECGNENVLFGGAQLLSKSASPLRCCYEYHFSDNFIHCRQKSSSSMTNLHVRSVKFQLKLFFLCERERVIDSWERRIHQRSSWNKKAKKWIKVEHSSKDERDDKLWKCEDTKMLSAKINFNELSVFLCWWQKKKLFRRKRWKQWCSKRARIAA